MTANTHDNVLPLRRIRVLVAARDPRWSQVLAFLLARSGHEVATTRRPARIPDAIQRHRANVVIVDGSESVETAVRLAATAESVSSSVELILVTDSWNPAELPNFNVLSKWDFDDLVEEVRNVYMRIRAIRSEAVLVERG